MDLDTFLHVPLKVLAPDEAGSTNDIALATLENHQAALVWTLHQRQGRGSRGRQWSNPPGCGLAFSLAFNQDIAPSPSAWCYPLFAGLIWFEALQSLGVAKGLSLKWPNDIFWDGRKLAGILCESRWRRNRVHTVIGIGTNLKPHAALDALPDGYATLSECAPSLAASALITCAIKRFQEGFEIYKSQALLRQTWLKHAWIQPGQNVSVRAEGKRFEGIFRGLTEDGALNIQRSNDEASVIQPTCTDFHLEALANHP